MFASGGLHHLRATIQWLLLIYEGTGDVATMALAGSCRYLWYYRGLKATLLHFSLAKSLNIGGSSCSHWCISGQRHPNKYCLSADTYGKGHQSVRDARLFGASFPSLEP
ncbi:hypothetical protein FOZG_17240 [Fusarium oxysporum Fo47]|uniref:Uncharacterized protein n=1 Tax=Fusarium oxysporum Fo47 TaxID=660027 RepID=W9JB97_FUSOX|nr:hypothetical protein FOZG_17240 [Fusarium oxysporum Fo47]EWZ29144.1 hypothetical protein FOZG_17240 [Fusarium oxysporum Fo47]EWZ29145.1 hypothetical protein FOZG_17240 [Fusarium oxysporum Fo47]EWZ29146.1 hypothetical protein FOZG_17240 [Fusarium oxysporum Fo47]EWZ29147.1 hypothetical protein FOZG_17240 [Fusarium oxysporum Fo47]